MPLSSIAHKTRSCNDAARGLAGATRSVRDPEVDVYDALVDLCTRHEWPTPAIDCFATMSEGDLGRCGHELQAQPREALFGALAGNGVERAGLVIARARLEQLQVGIPECDEFVAAVNNTLACEAMPVEVRVQLGNETAQFWSLPTDRLGADDLRKMSEVCGSSLMTLHQQANSVGCKL